MSHDIPYRLAQCNISRMIAPLDSPTLAPFVAQLATINALAEAAPGFVWRLQTPAGDATLIRVFDDDRIIINMSVWESIEALHAFTYRTQHTGVVRMRDDWFERMTDYPHLTLWWMPAGEFPDASEVKMRLDHLHAHGPTDYAFTFKTRFPMPSSV